MHEPSERLCLRSPGANHLPGLETGRVGGARGHCIAVCLENKWILEMEDATSVGKNRLSSTCSGGEREREMECGNWKGRKD